MKQIIMIQPKFYHHRWEMKFGKIELVISIPQNIEEVIAGMEASENTLNGQMPGMLR